MERALWKSEKFKKEYPSEQQYRHAAKEEVDALQLMVTVLKEQKGFAQKAKDLEPGIVEVIKLDEAGLIEPYVLVNRADAEITKDYPAYRTANRDEVRQYLSEFVLPKTPLATN